MAMSALLPRHVFGFRADVRDNVHFLEDGTIVHPAGHNTVLYNLESKAQKFIPGTPVDCEGITCLSVSPNKKFLAVAERAEKGQITVYDLLTLKRRKVLVSSEAGSRVYVSLSFSPDGKLLAAQGGAPEWNLMLWLWEKSKVASTVRSTNQQGAPLYQVAFCPSDLGIVSTIGNGILRTYKTTDNNLKPQPSALAKRDPQNYAAHAWMVDGDKERMVVGTDTGELLVVEGAELKGTFYTDNGAAVSSLAAYSKGFVVGLDDGSILIFEKDDKEMFRRTKRFVVEGHPFRITTLSVAPDEATLVAALEDSQVFTLALNNIEIMKVDEMNFEPMATAFHNQGITGLDVCVRKPLVATCSTDKSVRIWNYSEKATELVKLYADEAFSIALHPTGSTVLVGFADKLRLMTVLMDDLKTYRELSIKACRECRFSNGGQLFAATNGNTIQVYNTYTCENVGNLRGHNGKVRSLWWTPDDSKILSAGMDGAVYEWRMRDFKRDKENVLKGCNYTCVVGTPDTRTIFAVGSDCKLKELEDREGSGTQVVKEFDTGTTLNQILLSPLGRIMFAGTDTGAVRSYKFPLTGEYHEFRCQNGAITRLRCTYDSQLLFATSEDGSLFVFEVRDKDDKGAAKREQDRMPFAEEVLVTKAELEEKKARMGELETQVNELTMQNEYQLKLKDLDMNERVKELTDKFSVELEQDRAKFEILLQEKNEQEMEYEEKLKAAEERLQAQLGALDAQYQAKIMAEVERYQQLMQEKELLNERWDEQNALLVESHERVIQELTEEYEAKLQEEQLHLQRLQADKAELEREFEEIKRQLEEDADREIEELKERYEQRLGSEREIGLRLKGENGIMKKKFNQLKKDIDDQREEIRGLHEKEKDLYATIGSLEKDIAALRKEIREREGTIEEKERRIYDLKKKNQELEKFKFVLDYKIKELKKQIEPREQEIADMKEQIKEMDNELERYHRTNTNLDLAISDLKLKQTGLQGEVLAQRSAKYDAGAAIKRFQHDLHDLLQHVQDPKALKEKAKALYQKHVTSLVPARDLEDDIQREYNRQREYLEKTVESLKRKLAKDTELHRTDNMKVMQENVALIKEINELRREIKGLKQAQGRANAAARLGRTGGADDGLAKEVGMQRDVIAQLREDIAHRDATIAALEAQVVPRPMSRERLPPMEGFNAQQQPEVPAQ